MWEQAPCLSYCVTLHSNPPLNYPLDLVGQVPEYLKRQKEPDQLAALLQMLQCLLNNKHFAFLEIYVSEQIYWRRLRSKLTPLASAKPSA